MKYVDREIKLPNYWDYKAIFTDLNGTIVPDYDPRHGKAAFQNCIKAVQGKLRYRLDADRFLISAKMLGMPIALVTDVNQRVVDLFRKSPAISSAAYFDTLFNKIFCNDMWKSKGKDKYFGYEMAMEQMGLYPDQVLVFEDSKKGIDAARKAKLDVCVIENPNIKIAEQDVQKGRFYIESFNNLM